ALQQAQGGFLENGLPFRGQLTVAVLLGTTPIAGLFRRGRVEEVAIGVPRDKGQWMRGALLQAQADFHGELGGKGEEVKISDAQGGGFGGERCAALEAALLVPGEEGAIGAEAGEALHDA